MGSLRDFANLANTARGAEAREVYKVLRNLLAIVKANIRVERSIGDLEAQSGEASIPPEESPKITPPPRLPDSPEVRLPNQTLNQVIDIGAAKVVKTPKPANEPKKGIKPAPQVPKPASPKSAKDAVKESISRLLRLPQAENVDAKTLLPEPFELVISGGELPPATFLAAPYRQVKAREEVLGILDSFAVLGWGGCAECQNEICGECKDGGIRVKMTFDTVAGTTFRGTAWKSQIAMLLRCTVPKLIEVWVSRPDEINARLSKYLGRPFHVVGITREWQEELTYSLNALTCLHWGAVASALDQRASNAGGDGS